VYPASHPKDGWDRLQPPPDPTVGLSIHPSIIYRFSGDLVAGAAA